MVKQGKSMYFITHLSVRIVKLLLKIMIFNDLDRENKV